MKPRSIASLALLVMALAMQACVIWVDPEPAPIAARPAPPRDWMAEIRKAAAASTSIVEATPLLDPAVADLRAQAKTAEDAGQFAEADVQLKQAVGVRADDPDLWQWRAEIALARKRWREAATFAQRSLELGPRIGTLCIRNWLSLEAARTELGDLVSAKSARAQVKSCEVPDLIRM